MRNSSFRFLSLLAIIAFASAVDAESPEDHWAWKKPTRPVVPAKLSGRTANPIDAFVLVHLEQAGLTFSPRATREQRIRRASFGLIGLPPTPAEIEDFVRDPSPDAWERVVDRLLASPQYGERWGRHWLDLVRYADTNGYEFDEPRPDAWRYRDYVIRSLNADKPFDRFAIEQLAGDEENPGDRDAQIATGFNLLGPDMTDASDQNQRRQNTLNDMTDTASLTFLGLTMGCARCHDHKFEPIPQTDYYRLQAFFTPAVFRRDLAIATPQERTAYQAGLRRYEEATKPIRDQLAALEGPHRSRLYEAKLKKLSAEAQQAHRTPANERTGGQQELVAETAKKMVVSEAEISKAMSPDQRAELASLKKRMKGFDNKKPGALPIAMGLTDRKGPAPKTHLLERGELSHPADEVFPGFPTTLSSKGEQAAKPQATGGRRLTLAKWIASPDNPLTARVIVNRLWQHHFGQGIVVTASDFGRRGERPSHPELLDYLAVEFASTGWSLKQMHRRILLSETYQQSSKGKPSSVDPDNRLLSRMNRLRLEGEAVRDTLLAISGRLNSTAGGRGVVLPNQTAAAGGSRPVAVSKDPRDHARRSVYLFSRRNLRNPFLEAFDLPDSNLSCSRRERSTTAPQALALLNADDATIAAKSLAERLKREKSTEHECIDLAYRIVLGRSPTAGERSRANAFLTDSPMSELCRALMNSNEFVYLD